MLSDKLLFGQFLIEKKKLNQTTLDRAIEKQDSEKINDKPRMLGAILLNDFKVFKDRIELKKYLNEFEVYKADIQRFYIDAKKYGVEPELKLQQEYADLLEELELPSTIKIRELIRNIEKVKLDIKNNKKPAELFILEDEIADLKKQIELNDIKIQKLNNEINSLKNDILKKDNLIKSLRKYLKKYIDLYGDMK